MGNASTADVFEEDEHNDFKELEDFEAFYQAVSSGNEPLPRKVAPPQHLPGYKSVSLPQVQPKKTPQIRSRKKLSWDMVGNPPGEIDYSSRTKQNGQISVLPSDIILHIARFLRGEATCLLEVSKSIHKYVKPIFYWINPHLLKLELMGHYCYSEFHRASGPMSTCFAILFEFFEDHTWRGVQEELPQFEYNIITRIPLQGTWELSRRRDLPWNNSDIKKKLWFVVEENKPLMNLIGTRSLYSNSYPGKHFIAIDILQQTEELPQPQRTYGPYQP